MLFSALKADLERVLEAADGPGMFDDDEDDLQRALAMSRQEIDMEDEEADLRRAIQLSMQGLDALMCTLVILGGVGHVLGFSES